MLTKEELPECPVATTVSLIGSKWKLLIIRNLLERPWRFNELKKNLEGISQKVLTDSLRSMENDGLIIRTVYPEIPPRVEYSLSKLGLTLKPILDSMVEWGNAYKKMQEEILSWCLWYAFATSFSPFARLFIEIKKLMLEKQISQREITEQLNIKPQGLTKLLNKKNFGFEDAQKILSAMGYDLIIGFQQTLNAN